MNQHRADSAPDREGPRGLGGPRPRPSPAEPQPEPFGVWLRQQRELREIELREIADRTKISIRYLRAMEQDRFELLPAPVFARGFLREYAKYVGLDPDETVNFYLATRQEGQEEPGETDEPVQEEAPDRGRRLALLLALLAAAALVILAVVLVMRLNGDAEPTEPLPPSAAAPAAQDPPGDPIGAAERGGEPLVAPEDPLPDAGSGPLVVTVDFLQDCWVSAVIDGRERIEQRYVEGESLRLEAVESVVFQTLGNAGGVTVRADGHAVPISARPGQVVHDLRIDRETVATLAAEGRSE